MRSEEEVQRGAISLVCQEGGLRRILVERRIAQTLMPK